LLIVHLQSEDRAVAQNIHVSRGRVEQRRLHAHLQGRTRPLGFDFARLVDGLETAVKQSLASGPAPSTRTSRPTSWLTKGLRHEFGCAFYHDRVMGAGAQESFARTSENTVTLGCNGVLFPSGPPPFDLIAISQSKLVLQCRQQDDQFFLGFRGMCPICEFRINCALKPSNNQRIKFRAPYEMTICDFLRSLTKLTSRYVAVEVSLKEVHYQKPLGAAPMAEVDEVKRYEDPEKNRSPNDATECVAVHKSRFHLAGSVAIRGVVNLFLKNFRCPTRVVYCQPTAISILISRISILSLLICNLQAPAMF
jgi:hypothetical protein